jgi:hypothetical protein
MDSSTYSVIEDPLTSERPDNATPTSSEDWSLTAAVAEVTSLWTNTSRSIVAARTGLYIFLGATYEHAHNVQRNSSALHELRLEVRRQFSSDRQKKRIGSASAEELLLVSALGVNQGSLRSKYKALFAKAANEQIPRDRESFKFWLWSNGGIVKALRDAVSDDAPPPRPVRSIRPFKSCAGDLLKTRTTKPIEKRMFDKQPHDGFVIVLFYIDPQTKQTRLMAELNDVGLIDQAVRLSSEQLADAPAAEAA